MFKIILCIVGLIQISKCNRFMRAGNNSHRRSEQPRNQQHPNDYIKYGNSFYKYHDNKVTFAQAALLCEEDSGHLAILNTHDEAVYLGNLIGRLGWAYIGFHDYFKEGQYTTILGQSLSYVNWAKGQPDNAKGNENCGALNRAGTMNDVNCSKLAPFICEIEMYNCQNHNPPITQQSIDNQPLRVSIKYRNNTNDHSLFLQSSNQPISEQSRNKQPSKDYIQYGNSLSKYHRKARSVFFKNNYQPISVQCRNQQPPKDYIQHGNSLYKYHKNTATFAGAVQLCDGENAHLAILNSHDETLYLRDLIKRHEEEGPKKKINWVYIGIHDLFKEGQFTTIFGEPVYKTGYVNWANGQPDNDKGDENCGSLRRAGNMNDVNCSKLAPFICEMEMHNCQCHNPPITQQCIEDQPLRVSRNQQPPKDYIQHGNSLYKYHKNTATFADAVQLCDGENAHLAILNSHDETLYLRDLIKRHEEELPEKQINWVYIGFHDYFKEGQYTTILGESVYKTGYVNWEHGQPDNKDGNENCGSLTRDGLMNDLDCGRSIPFICEIEIICC